MRFIRITAALAGAALFASQAWATTVCERDGLTRNVSIIYSNPGQSVPCEVLY
jgi:hypothetical protein